MKSTVVIDTDKHLLSAFRNRDLKYLWLPKNMTFPLIFDYYYTWSEPEGNYQYLVFRKPDSSDLVGMIFKRDQGQQHPTTQMCQWCRSFGPSDTIDMLSISVNAKRLLGVVLCIDLSCLEKLDTVRKFSKKSYGQLAQELVQRMTDFHQHVREKDL